MKKGLVLCVVLLLAGCQPPPPFVIATIEAGMLTFHIRQRGFLIARIFGWDDATNSVDRLAIVSGNVAIARFEKGNGATQPCRSSNSFPVTLGEKRCGYRWIGSNYLPVVDSIYEVYLNSCSGLPEGCDDSTRQYWSDAPVGRFKLAKDGSVSNIRPD